MANNSNDFAPDFSDTKALFAEFLGTMLLVLAAAGAGSAAGSIPGGGSGAWAAGLTLVVLVFMFGPVSGAHFNPAISVGMTIAGRLPKSKTLAYLAAQLCGALLAGLILRLALNSTTLGLTTTQMPPLGAILIEAVLTFWLQWVILSVTEKDVPLLMTGLAIGFALGAAGMWGGHLSGASLNPARTLGPAIAAWDFSQVWIYLLGPVVGSSVAAMLYGWYKGLR
jgi:MIP family channel proteins